MKLYFKKKHFFISKNSVCASKNCARKKISKKPLANGKRLSLLNLKILIV